MLYTKNGSIPKPETDGTEGWIEVSEPPIAGEGQEVIWCYPPGWVVRDVMPLEREGYRWMHFLDRGWVEYQSPQTIVLDTEQVVSISSAQVDALSSAGIVTLTSEQISGL
jgi:hypothetical protein